jgi:hypothetical protein
MSSPDCSWPPGASKPGVNVMKTTFGVFRKNQRHGSKFCKKLVVFLTKRRYFCPINLAFSYKMIHFLQYFEQNANISPQKLCIKNNNIGPGSRKEKVAREKLDFLIAFGEALNNLDPGRADLLQLQTTASEILQRESTKEL